MTDKLRLYSTTPGDNDSSPPNGWPEGQLPSTVNNCAREMMARLREWYEDAEWLDLNHAAAPAYNGFTASTFILNGDYTAFYKKGRSLRFNGTTLAIVSIDSVFAVGLTTVTFVGTTLGGAPSSIEAGMLNSSFQGIFQGPVTARDDFDVEGDLTVDGATTLTGAVELGAAINGAGRVGVVSGTANNLDAVATNYVRFTGGVALANPTLSDGRWRHCVLGPDTTLTHHATDLILPTGANIAGKAGDTFILLGEPSSAVRLVAYQKANGKALVETVQNAASDGASLVLLSSQTASGSASLDFTSLITSTYDEYRFSFVNIRPDSSGAQFRANVSYNNGSSYESGAVHLYAAANARDTAALAGTGNGGAAFWPLSGNQGISNASSSCLDGEMTLYNPLSTTFKKQYLTRAAFMGTTDFITTHGGGQLNVAASAIDAIKFIMSTGNIASGTIRMYGVKKS